MWPMTHAATCDTVNREGQESMAITFSEMQFLHWQQYSVMLSNIPR